MSGTACISSSKQPLDHHHIMITPVERRGRLRLKDKNAHSLLTISRLPGPMVGHDPPQQDSCLQMSVPSAGAEKGPAAPALPLQMSFHCG